ncbi:MAG: hypothetical protein JWR73_50, partial [Tardiphaga sp.]|nr:hypothetical protein [Tardiphaga sp.]
DLMPAVLVLILCVVHAAIRREGLPDARGVDLTAGDMLAALRMARELETARREVPGEAVTSVDLAPVAARNDGDENVTPLSSARHPK